MGAENPVPNPSLWTPACCSVYRLIVFFLLFPNHIWSCSAAHQCSQMCRPPVLPDVLNHVLQSH